MALNKLIPFNPLLMAKQVQYYRCHLDVFILQQFPPIKLTKTQRVIARNFGNCSDGMFVCSRGYGKTWLTAVLCFAVCCLYPDTPVIVTSKTAGQATLVLQKIKLLVLHNTAMRNELKSSGTRNPVRIQKLMGICEFKNGSSITSKSLLSARGSRAKICVVDERLDTNKETIDAVLLPIKNFTRPFARTYGFKDFLSKTISISSASLKGNSMYDDFRRILRLMAKGNRHAFACSLNYLAAAADGITDMSFFLKLKARMPQTVFLIEYNSIFVGSNENSAFPYDLTDPCRTLTLILLLQPKGSKSRYIMSIDLATSEAKTADNSIISVIKFIERKDGTFIKKLVYMRSFHGKGLDVLAKEVRRIYHVQFPNVERIIFDARGLGDSFPKFFDEPWIDVTTGKLYPPLVEDDTTNFTKNVIAALHPVRAIQSLNQRIYTNMRVSLLKRSLLLPINSRLIRNGKLVNESEEDTEGLQNKELKFNMKLIAIFQLTDALQFEMGNIIAKVGASGNVLYDTPRITMHKDRYSSLSYGIDYICLILKLNIKRKNADKFCIGFATHY